MGKTLRWVIPGSRPLLNDRAAILQSGSPPGRWAYDQSVFLTRDEYEAVVRSIVLGLYLGLKPWVFLWRHFMAKICRRSGSFRPARGVHARSRPFQRSHPAPGWQRETAYEFCGTDSAFPFQLNIKEQQASFAGADNNSASNLPYHGSGSAC